MCRNSFILLSLSVSPRFTSLLFRNAIGTQRAYNVSKSPMTSKQHVNVGSTHRNLKFHQPDREKNGSSVTRSLNNVISNFRQYLTQTRVLFSQKMVKNYSVFGPLVVLDVVCGLFWYSC